MSIQTKEVQLLSRNNPIPGEAEKPTPNAKPSPDSLPRIIKGAELQKGDKVLFAPGGDVTQGEADGWNGAGPFTVVDACDDAPDDVRCLRSPLGEHYVCAFDWSVQLLSRATTPTPTPDTDRLRRDWVFLVQQTPWAAMAIIHESNGWPLGGKPDQLRLEATLAFESELAKTGWGNLPALHLFVVLQPDNPDRPIELYSEALNGEAYRAKVAELWPAPVAKAEAEKLCQSCRQPIGYGRRMAYHDKCGDCFGAWDAGVFLGSPSALTNVGVAEPATEPSTHLTPGAAYHLRDDTGWATPSWEA